VTTYAHPNPAPIPFWKRCKVRHSPKTPARCKLARGHDGDCVFGWWHTGAQATNLDLPLPKLVYKRSTDPEDARP
jgi:hypothetical protein